MTRQSVTHLPISAVQPHPRNVRDELGDVTDMAASIRAHGILQPLVVTEHPTRPKTFLLLAGHRRRAAAEKAGLDRVPCIIRHGLGGDENVQTALMLVENSHRRQLTPLEKARAIKRLLDTGMTQTEVGRAIGLPQSSVNTYVLLLEADDETTERLEAGDVTAADVRAAVKDARARRRTEAGGAVRGRPIVVEPIYFSIHHRLATVVKGRCTHTTRPLIGSIACGQCWEAELRAEVGAEPADDRTSFNTDAEDSPSTASLVDEVAVQRVLGGDHSVRLNVGEKREVVRRLHALQLSDGDIAKRMNITGRQVLRIRQELGLPAAVGVDGRPLVAG